MPECCEGLLEHTLQLPAIEQPVAGADENAAPAVPPPPPVMPPLAKASSGGAMALIHAEELQRLRQGLRPVVPASPKVAASPARTAVKRKSVRFTASANATPEGVCDATMVLTAHTGSSPAVDVMADSTMAFAQWAMGTHVAEITPGSTHRQSVQRRTSTPAATRAVVGTPRTSAKSSAAQRTPAARTPSAATPNTMPMASAGGTAARSTRGKSRLANASVGGLSSAVDDTMQATLDVAMMAAARMFTVVVRLWYWMYVCCTHTLCSHRTMLSRPDSSTSQICKLSRWKCADMRCGIAATLSTSVQDMVQKAVEAALQAHAEFHDEQPAAGTGAPVDVIDDPPQHAHPAPHEPCVADASRDAPHQCSDDILHETAHEEASQDEALVDMEEAIDVEAAQAMEDEAEETLNTCTMALSDAWDLHFAHGHAPSDVETAAKVARDVCDQASKVIRAGLAYRAQTGMLKKRLLRLTKANHALREQNKRLQLELMAANALLQAADLDDAAGSDYKPSPQPASETWATDEEVPSEPAHTPHSASQLAIIRQGRPIGASPASVAPRAGDATTSTQFRDTPTRRPVAATQLPLSNVEGWPSGVGAPPMSVTRSCTKGFVPVGATPVRRRSLLAPHVHEGLQASVAKCGLAPAAGYHATPSSEADLDDRVVAACNNDLNAGSSGLVVEESGKVFVEHAVPVRPRRAGRSRVRRVLKHWGSPPPMLQYPRSIDGLAEAALSAHQMNAPFAPAPAIAATPRSAKANLNHLLAACEVDIITLIGAIADTECDAGDGPEGELDEGIGHGQSRRGTRASARVTRAKTTESAAVEAPKARSARYELLVWILLNAQLEDGHPGAGSRQRLQQKQPPWRRRAPAASGGAPRPRSRERPSGPGAEAAWRWRRLWRRRRSRLSLPRRAQVRGCRRASIRQTYICVSPQ